MFNPTAFENSRPGGVAALEIPRHPESDEPRRFVPLKRTTLAGEVTGPLAALTVTHSYGYTREQCDLTLEAIYRFPLPGDAAVTGATVRFGDVEIRAELKERTQAEADYQEAKEQGKQAALVTREAPDVFTLSVAGIQPGQEIVVQTSYVQLARAEGAGWTLRVPLTIAPRYSRSDEHASPHAKGQPLLMMRDPGHRFLLDLLVAGGGRADSPTHDLEATAEQGGTRVRLLGGEQLPDRDCVLSWLPEQEQSRPALRVLTHRDPVSDLLYFLAMVAPPASPNIATAVPREAVLLVDHSGSMMGPKWAAADWAVKKFLAGLSEREGFGLGVFHSTTRWLSGDLQMAGPKALKTAEQFLQESVDTGGTELGVALEQGLALRSLPGDFSRHLLVITDAQVSDDGRILRLAEEESARKERRRISVLCVDAAPNAFLARELAERGGGVAHFLTSAPEAGDITTALDELLLDWSQPVHSGLRLEVDRPRVEASGRLVVASGREGWAAVDLGDLPAGRTVWVCGRVPASEVDTLRFRLAGGTGEEVDVFDIDRELGTRQRPALKALFGAWRVLGLDFLISSGLVGEDLSDRLARLGYDPAKELVPAEDERKKVYAENAREDARKALDGLLLRESLDYGLLTSATSFVAVRTEAGKVVDATVPVGNALPSGWSEDFLAGAGGHAMARNFLAGAGGSAVLRMASPWPAVRRASAPPPTAPHGQVDDPGLPAFSRRRLSLGGLGCLFYSGRGPEQERISEEPAAKSGIDLFQGKPVWKAGKAVLFDSTTVDGSFSVLTARFPEGDLDPQQLDPGLTLLLYLEDVAVPVMKVRLLDLVRLGGERPVNLSVHSGQRLMLVIADPFGAWLAAAPSLQIFML